MTPFNQQKTTQDKTEVMQGSVRLLFGIQNAVESLHLAQTAPTNADSHLAIASRQAEELITALSRRPLQTDAYHLAASYAYELRGDIWATAAQQQAEQSLWTRALTDYDLSRRHANTQFLLPNEAVLHKATLAHMYCQSFDEHTLRTVRATFKDNNPRAPYRILSASRRLAQNLGFNIATYTTHISEGLDIILRAGNFSQDDMSIPAQPDRKKGPTPEEIIATIKIHQNNFATAELFSSLQKASQDGHPTPLPWDPQAFYNTLGAIIPLPMPQQIRRWSPLKKGEGLTMPQQLIRPAELTTLPPLEQTLSAYCGHLGIAYDEKLHTTVGSWVSESVNANQPEEEKIPLC